MAADLVVVPSEVFARTAADYIARAVRATAHDGRLIFVALSGGKSPRPVYQDLARNDTVPWDLVELFFADERAVPVDDHRSNFRLVREALGSRFEGRIESIHRMEADRPDLVQAAEEYEALMPARFDLVVLGMGEDGHTASLFPGHPATGEQRRRVLAITGPVSPGRITITPPVIREAGTVLMLVAGEAKAAAVASALRGPFDPVQCPAQLAQPGTWILDEPAASLL